MSDEVLCLLPLVILVPNKDDTASLGRACRENEPILPGCPCDAIDRGAQVMLKDTVVPIVVHVAFPHFHKPTVATRGNHALILRVSPSDLPDWALVCLDGRSCSILTPIGAHIADLQEAIAITAGNLSAIVIKLAIVDVVLMLGVNSEDCVGSRGLSCCLCWLLGRCLGSSSHSSRIHHHVLLLLATHHPVVVPCLAHFSFVSKMAKTH